MGEGRRCAYVKDDGEGCGAYAMEGSAYCFSHNPDPEVAKKRKAARRKAGKVTSQRRILDTREARQQRARTLEIPEPPTDYLSASHYLSWVVDQVAHGRLEDTTGKTLIQGVKEFLRSLNGQDAQRRYEDAVARLDEVRRLYLAVVDEIEAHGLTHRARQLAVQAREILNKKDDS